MPEILIKVKTDSLNMGESTSRLVTGEICFMVGDIFFPEIRWNDFVVVILNWWLDNIKKLRNSAIGTSCDFKFMDGPFLVRGLKIEPDTIRMTFIKGRLKGEDILLSVNCNMENLADSLLKAAKEVIKEVNNRKWETKEIDDLRKIIKLLGTNG